MLDWNSGTLYINNSITYLQWILMQFRHNICHFWHPFELKHDKVFPLLLSWLNVNIFCLFSGPEILLLFDPFCQFSLTYTANVLYTSFVWAKIKVTEDSKCLSPLQRWKNPLFEKALSPQNFLQFDHTSNTQMCDN